MKRSIKGVELPVNILVIIAIAVLVLLGLIVLLSFGTAGANPILVALDKGPACQKYNCGNGGTSGTVLIDRDVTGDGKKDSSDNLAELCTKSGNCPSTATDDSLEAAVKKWCGCKIEEAAGEGAAGV